MAAGFHRFSGDGNLINFIAILRINIPGAHPGGEAAAGVLRGGGDVNASLVIDNFPLWCGTLPVMCLLGLVLKVPNEVFCLCLMIEYIIKSPLGLYRLHSGKWIHDITRIDE